MTTKIWSREQAEALAESDRRFREGFKVPEDAKSEMPEQYREWLRPMLMSQRQALLMQVDSIERTLGIEPTTADLRKSARCDRMVDKEGG